MRAITCTGYGAPTEVLRLDDIAVPSLADDEVLVAVHAASLNPADWHLVRGLPYLARLQVGLRRPPFEVPGSDVAGRVEAVGPAVTTVRPGDEVYGTTFMAGFGALAERVAVPERLVAHRPQRATVEQSAGLPLAATTALQALRDHGGLEAGQRVLVIGAAGGVGSHAVQLAKAFGAEVTGVCSTSNVEHVRSLGADHVVDRRTEDLIAAAGRHDLVVQLAGTQSARELRTLVEPDGTLLSLSGDSPNRWIGPLGRVVTGLVLGRAGGPTVRAFTVQPDRADLELLARLVDDGRLTTSVERRCDLADAPRALEELERGHARGKVVVTLGPEPGAPEDTAATGTDHEARVF